ncbi:solute carrier organic anion transporter family member 74D [Parasteatoda tepidariorum]|uniref:solute carrier organic anion transporter family member 74D n=1 Tax=Parasteatoda tepidariorum TaxID=114398 RepID=UPI001C720EAB|nr:solute carrier organic anion transporter family member 74D [Parasteatoda tepidariorum]
MSIGRKSSIGHVWKSEKENGDIADNEDTSCGIGGFHPTWLQRFNSPKSFLVNNGLLGTLNGATFTHFIGCISTLEKRYAFETQVTGLILMAEELCPFLLGFLLGYFGSRTHRPRFIAASMCISTLSSFVLAGPYFLYGPIRDTSVLKDYVNQTDFQLCGNRETDELCNKSPRILAVSLLFIGLIMKGLGNTAFYSIGTPFLDDNINKKNTALYLATSMTLQLLGPALGFLLSSFCLQFYEDPFYDPGFGPDDPRWVGAWWMGFVIIGMFMFIFMLPAWLYPRHFPGVNDINSSKKRVLTSVIEYLKDMKTVLIRLYKNPLLMCNQLGTIMRINAIEGYYILMPKYLEMQFKQSASMANLLSGPVVIVLMMIGIMGGGFGISKFRPSARKLTGGIVITQILTVISFIACMLIMCSSTERSGTDTIAGSEFSLENDCNRDCFCTTKAYTPICEPDSKSEYFSPCYAGCIDYKEEDGKKIYTNCSCVHDEAGEFTHGDAQDGFCGFQCQGLMAYVIILSAGKFVFSCLGVANPIITLRAVDPADKSVVIGAVSPLYSLLAFFPYPLIYGALTDSSCQVWEKSCGKTGNCWIYDLDDFRYKLHGVTILFLALAAFFDICVWILSKNLHNLYVEADSAVVANEEREMNTLEHPSSDTEMVENISRSETESDQESSVLKKINNSSTEKMVP